MAISGQLAGVLDNFVVWLDCVRHPFNTCERILRGRTSERDKLGQALKLWLVAFVIHIVLRIPALQHAGIDWSNGGYQIANMALILLTLLLAVVLVHLALRWRGIPSRFIDTFVMYTVLILVFVPLNTLLFYYTNFETPAILREIKNGDMGFAEALQFYLFQSQESRPAFIRIYQAVSWPLFVVAWSAFVVMFAEMAVRAYKADRYRVVSALSVVFCVVLPIAVLPLAMFITFLTYSFLR